jgi:hypothetical protein
MDSNMVFALLAKLKGVEEEVSHMCLGPREAVFVKPKVSTQQLKSLYVWGHINEKLISKILINSGTAVNLMSYNIFKNLGRDGGQPGGSLGVISMELTVGRESVVTMFLVVEVQGNYSVILGRDWIHTNRCIPSTLHQFIIKWIDDEIEVVHVDALAYIALANTTVD